MPAEIEAKKLGEWERLAFLIHVKQNPKIGNVTALRQLGVTGTKGELRSLLDDDIVSDAREARGYGDNAIRNAMYERAINGVDEVHVTNTGREYTVRKYSDRLLAKMADMYLPEAQAARRLELTGAGGGPVEIEDRSASLADVASILVRVGALAGAALVGGGAAGGEVPAPRGLLAESEPG